MDIVILGAGGQGREILWLINGINKVKPSLNVLGFLDDDAYLQGQVICDIPVLGPISWLGEHPGTAIGLGIGDPKVKKRILSEAVSYDLKLPNIIAPDVTCSDYVTLGEGVIISSGSVLTTHVTVGNFSLVNYGCTIGHDVNIGTGVSILPGVHISGNCNIGDYVSVGSGAVLIPGVSVGQESIIGAGSVVIRDVPDGVTVVGNPARQIHPC